MCEEARALFLQKQIRHQDLFQRSTFVGSAWSFSFFIPATTANDLRLQRISIPDCIHYICFPILILQPVFPLLMLSAIQWNYWCHFYNVFGMTRSRYPVPIRGRLKYHVYLYLNRRISECVRMFTCASSLNIISIIIITITVYSLL